MTIRGSAQPSSFHSIALLPSSLHPKRRASSRLLATLLDPTHGNPNTFLRFGTTLRAATLRVAAQPQPLYSPLHNVPQRFPARFAATRLDASRRAPNGSLPSTAAPITPPHHIRPQHLVTSHCDAIPRDSPQRQPLRPGLIYALRRITTRPIPNNAVPFYASPPTALHRRPNRTSPNSSLHSAATHHDAFPTTIVAPPRVSPPHHSVQPQATPNSPSNTTHRSLTPSCRRSAPLSQQNDSMIG